jgi:hypothetical protein
MVLSEIEVKQYILNPQNTNIINYQVKLKEMHELYLTGINIDKFIEKVDKIENEDYLNVKKKLKNAITVKAYEKVLRPKDKIISAKGGSIIYEFDGKDNDLETKLKKALKNLRYNGHSLESYTNDIWLDYGIWIDPMGLTLIGYEYERLADDTYKKTNNLKIDYISVYDRLNFKSAEDCGEIYVNYHDFVYTSFDRIEYLILNWGEITKYVGSSEKKYKIYRVIDDETDALYWQEIDKPENIFLQEGSLITHGFDKVPAVFNSNRLDKISANTWFTTYCSESLITAKDYLNDYIDYRIYKKKVGLPRMWQFKMPCQKCNGQGYIESPKDSNGKYYYKSQYITCDVCHGKGYDTERNLTDIAELDVLREGFASNVPPFGVVTLPTDIQQQLLSELDQLEFDLAEVVWGQGSAVDKERRDTTAFEISVRNESKIDKLRAIEKNKAKWQTAIINLFGGAMFESFQGVFITPATQFLIATPTEARQVYLESKKADSSEEQLNKLWVDYLETEYQNDPISLDRHLVIMLLVPMFHFDLPEAWKYLTEIERLIKKNFDNYLYRYETENKENIVVAKDQPEKINEIYESLKAYAEEDKTQNNDTSIQQNTGTETDV